MYDFHYNYIKAGYGLDAKLFFTGIGSLAYEIKIYDVYEKFYEHRDLFDF